MGLGSVGVRKPDLHDQAWHYLLGLGPDLAFLQETLPPAWTRSEGTLIHGPFKRWGSVIFSPRYPLERFRIPQESNLRALGSYLAFATASLPDGTEAFVASVHARDGGATEAQLGSLTRTEVRRPSAQGVRVNDVAFAGLEGLVGDRFIVAGDWNTARGQRSQRGRKAGSEFFERAHARGWYDCVWDKTGGELQTFFRKGSSLKQNDHAFCDRELGRLLGKPRAAAETATVLALSDHAPLILDFDMAPIAITSLEGRPVETDS